MASFVISKNRTLLQAEGLPSTMARKRQNHSPNPSCGNDPTRRFTLALRDIAKDEELTDDYSTMEDSWAPFAGIIEPERME